MGAAKNAEDLPAEVEGWLGKDRYVENTTFPIEMGYVYTSCASVENGNPLFWDEAVAGELTDGPIAPPTLLSAWFRPHHWVPNQAEQSLPLQVHFDLKESLGLPEAVMTDNTIVFGVPVRPGDVLTTCQVLHSVSELKQTKLGTGRFWEIEVRYTNQQGESVGTEWYTGYGYTRGHERGAS
jgi:acyl dehydratase